MYPVKIMSEKVRYVFTINKEGKVYLHLRFADKRTNELAQSFKRTNRVNKKLLNAMLNEALVALKHAELQPDEEARNFVKEIGRVNQYQKAVLEEIRQNFNGYDIEIMNEAINVCAARHHHIQQRLNPELNYEQFPYLPVWEKCCDWK
jgi:hypothetical protein